MSSLTHAVGFLQAAYTIVLGLALTEGFKQFVPDRDEKINWNRFWPLVGFLFLIFPFFHGMSRYFYTTYLSRTTPPDYFAGYLMFDGIAFLLMSISFFALSRSFAVHRWRRYHGALTLLLLVDSAWICVVLYRGVEVSVWLWLNAVLAAVMISTYLWFRRNADSLWPVRICAMTICLTTIASYFLMTKFYFG
jgi:hypothetical protein